MLEVILLVDGHSMPYLDQYSTMPLMENNTLLLQVDRVMQNALSLFKKETAYKSAYTLFTDRPSQTIADTQSREHSNL